MITAPDSTNLTDRERIYRRNFACLVADSILATIATSIIGPTTLIPDFVRHLTHSEILIGFSASLFDIGTGLPQLWISRYVGRAKHKKWWFIGLGIPMRVMMLLLAGAIVVLGSAKPEATLLAFLICYGTLALDNGLVIIPWADLVGSSLDQRWRAHMFGSISAGAALIVLGITPLIGLILGDTGPAYPNNYALLFGMAGVLFAFAIIPALFIHEIAGRSKAASWSTLNAFLPMLKQVVQSDAPFRTVVFVRLLLVLLAMAGPFYIGFATMQLRLPSTVAVPILLAMQTIGAVMGGLIYGWLGARDNALCMRLALGGAMLVPLSALLAISIGPLSLYIGFLISGLTLSSLFDSFQNWVITYAPSDRRTVYVGLFNTLTTIMAVATPFLAGTIVQSFGYPPLFIVAFMTGIIALFITQRAIHNPAG